MCQQAIQLVVSWNCTAWSLHLVCMTSAANTVVINNSVFAKQFSARLDKSKLGIHGCWLSRLTNLAAVGFVWIDHNGYRKLHTALCLFCQIIVWACCSVALDNVTTSTTLIYCTKDYAQPEGRRIDGQFCPGIIIIIILVCTMYSQSLYTHYNVLSGM